MESSLYIFDVLSGIKANISSTSAISPCFCSSTITGRRRLIMSGRLSAAPAVSILISLSFASAGSIVSSRLIPSSSLITSNTNQSSGGGPASTIAGLYQNVIVVNPFSSTRLSLSLEPPAISIPIARMRINMMEIIFFMFPPFY